MVSSSASTSGWFRSDGVDAWKKAGDALRKMANKVEAAATTAATEEIAKPLADSLRTSDPEAAEAVGVYQQGDNLYVGIKDSEIAGRSRAAEYGDDNTPPTGALRTVLLTKKAAAVNRFNQELQT